MFSVLIFTVQRLVVITSFKFINNKLTINKGNLNMKLTLIFSAIAVTFVILMTISKLEKNNNYGTGAINSYREFTFLKSI